jgi:antitoxin component YwqK of YwqJK toxin-antitoxin module
MNTGFFIVMFSLSLGAYLFGDFNTFYGVVPDGGNIVNAWAKGLLLGAASWALINKLRDFITINSSVKMLIIIGITSSGYFFEAGKEQRVGRKLLSKHFSSEAADGAWIHYAEKGKWANNAVLIEFTKTEMNPSKDFPNYRKIPYCNINFDGAQELLGKIPKEKLAKASFYWSSESTPTGTQYKIVGLLSDNRNWFFETAANKEQRELASEIIENARVLNSDGSYIDQACAPAPYTLHKKLYGANKTLKSEWYEKDGTEKFNEILYDSYGRPLSGQVDAEFVYFVEKSEEFQKGFGKAGMLKCVGYYTYKNGIKHGYYEFYYPGRIAKAFTGQYDNGVQVGVQKHFNPNGTLKKSWDLGGIEQDVISTEKDSLSLSR